MLAAALAAFPAHAQSICGARADVLKHLRDNHAEAPTARGLGGNGSVVELLTAANGSWSLIFTIPNGRTCLLATGEAWETVKPEGEPS